MNIAMSTGSDAAAVPQFRSVDQWQDASDQTNQLYGRYEFDSAPTPCRVIRRHSCCGRRARVWPRDGESLPEGSANGHMEAFMHHQEGADGGDQAAFSTNYTYADWHTAVIEWSPTAVKFFDRRNNIGTGNIAFPIPRCTGPADGNRNGAVRPIPHQPPGSVQVDYVKVWSYSPSTVVN